MNNYDLINKVGRVFVYGETDSLKEHLSEGCEYISEYANQKITTPKEIIERMNFVYSNLDIKSSYKFKIVPIQDILKKKNKLFKEQHNTNSSYISTLPQSYALQPPQSLRDCSPMNVGASSIKNDEYAILLYQHSDEYPVAVVSIETDSKTCKITKILLSRNSEIYNVDFYRLDMGEDSPLDLPSTVKALSPDLTYINFVNFNNCANPEDYGKDKLYIWIKSDEYIKNQLLQMGYRILESQIYEDCIGYKVVRNDCAYTIYMFAYGKKRDFKLNAEYCKKLLAYDFSKNSLVLVLDLKVRRYKTGEKIEYEFCDYYGNKSFPYFWRVISTDKLTFFLYYPRKEIFDTLYKLMYAFNNRSLDVYDCIITKNNPCFLNYMEGIRLQRNAFYRGLRRVHKKYGNMKLGCVSDDNFIFSIVPYIDNYGYFSFRVDNETEKIIQISSFSFKDINNGKTAFIGMYEVNSELYDNMPNLIKVEPFPPVDTERFALKLFYDNGECKKYVLPIKIENEKDESVSYQKHVFTDKIWKSAKISDDCSPEIKGYSNRLPKIIFDNGFFLSSLYCYYVGNDYSEPELTDDIIYEDEKCILKRIWKWNVNSVIETFDYTRDEISEDCETMPLNILKVLISGWAFNGFMLGERGISTFVTIDGERLCSLDFDYIDNFKEGYATVGKRGKGYGFIDRNMKIAISMKYDELIQLDGVARARKGNNYYQIDKQGNEQFIYSNEIFEKYQEVGEFCDGMCRVSILNLEGKLAYYSDSEFIAGICGYLNKEGKEVIPPQYIYANDFENGIAIVCKGKWTKDEKWGNKDKYWTETELWGAIDKNGDEVIPFIYDDIVSIDDYNEIFKAHYGGWEKGNWGVIDRSGKWLAEPVFEDIYGDCVDGLIVFCNNRFDNDDTLIGIYDIKNKKVLFEPQFSDADIFENGEIIADYFDKKLNKRIERIFDRNGKELFDSEYSYISPSYKDTYMVAKDNIDNRGLVDKKGKVLYPCGYNNLRFHYKEKLIEFSENNKVGLKDFDGNIVITPKYKIICNIGDVFYTVKTGVNEKSKVGLISPNGKIVVPLEFRRIDWLRDDKHIVCCRDGFCQMLEYIEK